MKKLLKKLKHYYLYNIRLSRKLMISYWLLLAIPTVVISIFIYRQIYQIVISDTIRSEQTLAEQTVTTVETTLRQLSNTASVIQSDSYLSTLRSDETPELPDSFVHSSQTSFFLKSVSSAVDGTVIKNIKLYMDTPFESLYHADTDVFEPMENAKGTYWYGIFSGTLASTLYCPSFYLSPRETDTLGDMALIQRIPYESDSSHTAAYLVIYFSQDSVDNTLVQDISINNSVTYIVNRRSALVATSDKTLSGTYFMDYPTLTDSIGEPDTFVIRNVLKKLVYTSYYPIRGTDWYLVSVIPAAPLMEKGTGFLARFLGVYLLFMTIAFILAMAISRSVTKRIRLLNKQMKTVRSGKLTPTAMEQGKDEVGELIDTYNYMADRINGLMDAQAKSAEKLRVAEFSALQAQINPHFLYNTLDMINWLSQSGQSDEVTEAVQTLSKFYKLTLSKKDIANTIEQELTHVSLYVQLQNMRYKDKIQFIVDVPDEFMEYEIPKLTFQPIVENAIQHGILEKEKKEGNIVLTAWSEAEELVFLISDDGVGMSEENLRIILQGRGRSKMGSNIGVYNTHQRLQLLYGEGYGLTYSSALGKGTEVVIRIPEISGES